MMNITEENDINASRNVLAIVAQVIISGVVLFVLYRYLYDQLGVEQIGIWSLVTSVTSVSRIGDLGLSASVVKFVAQALGRQDAKRAAEVVQTIAVTLALFMATVLIIGYPLFILALGYLLPTPGDPIAISILPYVLISLWMMVMVSVFSGGLDGCLRMDLRGLLTGSSYIVYLGLAMLLTPKYGLKGVVMAQLIQSAGLMILLWWILRKQLKDLPLTPWRWNFSVLREVFGYGASFQIISIVNMLFDPIVKSLMSRFAGLEALGYYGMANTFILQGRALIVESSRIMVPAIASLEERNLAKAIELFVTSYRMTFYISTLFYGLLGVSITSISMLWLGHYQVLFIRFALLLNIGWFANTLSVPAYFSNLGSGKLRANMINQIIVVLSSLIVGVTLGSNYDGIGVVIGVITGLIAGSMYLLITYIKQTGLHWFSFIVPRDMVYLLLAAVVVVFFSNFGGEQPSSVLTMMSIALLCSIPLLLLGWSNPLRMKLLGGGKDET